MLRFDEDLKKKEIVERWKWAERMLRMNRIIGSDFDPTNPEKQYGRHLTTEQFESMLRKLSPNFRFEHIVRPDGTIHPSCKRLVYVMPDQSLKYVCVYSTGLIPEFSIMERRVEEVPDITLKRVTRKDLPPVKQNPVIWYDPQTGDVQGEIFEFKGDMPWVKKVVVPGRELVRGWRTVLARIVLEGLASVADVERVFGLSDRLGWASAVGKTQDRHPMFET